ncbi:SgcJ/EcaC family oxidoreductase [candidate division WOR-3 bacterium]|nr:SgcJ/EcaC family oxidoreductase [candidate division WOR-3 bacterium]
MKINNLTNSDFEAIKLLHKKDKTASINKDAETLLSLFTVDGILIQPDGKIIEGIEELKKMLVYNFEQSKDYKITEYDHDFIEINVIGDYAFEWGSYRGKAVPIVKGKEISSGGMIMRILKRQKNGSWKIHRSIWN